MSLTTRARAKPNPSFASNRLTRNDPISGGHLLTSFRTGEGSQAPGSARPEPATDDEPLSLSEDESQASVDLSDDDLGKPSRYARRAGPTLQEKKLARQSPEGGETPRASRQRAGTKKKSQLPAPSSSASSAAADRKRTRTLLDMTDDGESTSDGEEVLFSSQFRSSNSSKRRKPTVSYASRKSFGGRVSPPSLTSPVSAASSQSPVRKNRSKKASKGGASKSRSSPQGAEEFKVPRAIIDSSPKPEFKAPPPFPRDTVSSSSFATSSARDIISLDLDDDSDSSPSTPLSSASSTLLEELSRFDEALLASGDDDEMDSATPSLCPWCKEPVPRELLIRFEAQPKQRMREQRQFCESHQQPTAERKWQEQGYPTIDWDGLDARLGPHVESLDQVLEPGSSSFYRNILDTKLKAGEAKNFRLEMLGEGLVNISCGYYGTRGSTKMLEHITARYARKLRRLAPQDHIIHTAGVVGYAQAVLVPELAVRLVKEDMQVDDERARQILRDSMELGETVNPALNDKITVEETTDEPTSVEGTLSV
ncbi:RTC4 family protein [Aspergillus homomorphus CBS 101889]|uniref:Restriction of telomere capping protein 4 n=1 Tax=Aspergillus homomorphus (strain CBS 101889) TaxID=1450537 RepID=A0A395HR12_ASPHC|nr:hypothetical protein BO97DRAFT_445166 [Aspergillus homomorphus CBS 101889]RAL09863.1 hypothetical protein BO97DRAFT_445166 [Aspergillus homomorphus CBS 101889]